MLRVLRLPLIVGLSMVLAACQFDVNRSIRKLLGGADPPAEHLGVLVAVHEKGTWKFKNEAEEPLQQAREAVRALPDCGYEDWAEVGRVVLIVSELAQEHPASLVRAEATDAMARIAAWDEFGEVGSDASVTREELIRALKQLREAYEYDEEDAAQTFGVADAVRTAAAFPFYQSAGAEELDTDEVLSLYATGLRTARAVLKTFAASGLQRFAVDPGVYQALESGNVAVSKAVVNLTLLERALADPQEMNRVAALRHLANLRFEGSSAVLARGVIDDDSLTVRREAVWALSELEPAVCVPTLIDALADVMSEVRSAAARALHRKTGQSFGDDRRAWALWWREKGAARERRLQEGEGE